MLCRAVVPRASIVASYSYGIEPCVGRLYISSSPTTFNKISMTTADDKKAVAAQQRLEDMEAKALSKAKATADAAFRPSPSILNAQSADALLSSVDGPSLDTYESKESVYVGRSVPVAAGAKIEVPIQVTTPGSVVEYAVELKAYDIAFGITAEREEGITIVKVCTGSLQ